MYARQKIKYSFAVHLRDTLAGTVCFAIDVYLYLLSYFIFLVIILVWVYATREVDSSNWRRDDQTC